MYWISTLNGWLWDHFLLILIAGTCLYFTIRLKGMPLRTLGYSLHQSFRRKDPHAQGEISPLQSMMTSLSAILGVGGIIGMATAIILGGFGAVFWMLLIAFFGLSLRYAESLLAIKYRTLNSKGEVCGGPMYYIAFGLKKKWLSICFASFSLVAALTGGIAIQAHGIALTVRDAMQVSPLATGIFLVVLIAIVLMGGVKRIAKLTTVLASTLALLYAAAGLIILVCHLDSIPHALQVIFTSAFSARALTGGVLGASLSAIIQLGLTWGITSQHIGWGNTAMAAAAAKTDVPARQALITMGGSFLCILMSAITALVLFVTDAPALIQSSSGVFTASSFVMQAFHSVIPSGDILVLCALFVFGFTAILGWGYYGEKCLEFLWGERPVLGYRALVCACILMGSICSLDILWPLSSCFNGLMALCNAIALMALSSVVAIETRLFFDIAAKERRQKVSSELEPLS